MAHGERAVVTANGSFCIKNVLPEHYSVEVSGLKDDYYLKGVYVGNQEATPGDVDLSNGSRQLRLMVSANGGRIDGTVLDPSQPAAAAAVALFPEPRLDAPHLYRKVTTDVNGKFVLRGIPPGNYKLFASNQIDMDSYRNPDIEIPFEKQGQAVTVEKNSRETLYLTLIRQEH
jgi:hypothetical protein